MEYDLIKIALAILQDEANGDTASAREKMDSGAYSMTWMYRSGEQLFPSVVGQSLDTEMSEAYQIHGRVYEIVHTAQSGNIVFIEMIESYPDEQSGQEFRTPIVLVLEFKDQKIIRGRHYTDPGLSHEHLAKEVIYVALGQAPTHQIRANK